MSSPFRVFGSWLLARLQAFFVCFVCDDIHCGGLIKYCLVRFYFLSIKVKPNVYLCTCISFSTNFLFFFLLRNWNLRRRFQLLEKSIVAVRVLRFWHWQMARLQWGKYDLYRLKPLNLNHFWNVFFSQELRGWFQKIISPQSSPGTFFICFLQLFSRKLR